MSNRFPGEYKGNCSGCYGHNRNDRRGGSASPNCRECYRRCQDYGRNLKITTHAKAQEGKTSNVSHTRVPVEPVAQQTNNGGEGESRHYRNR